MQKLQQLLLSTLISAAAIPASLHAQAPDNYPAKPVVIVIPYEGDGTMDTQLRMYMQAIQESAGKQFLLDHKGGGGTTVGTGYVARAAPDGYTLLAVNAPFVISPAIYPDLPYDNVRDFAPIAMLTKQFFHLTVHPSAPYRNVKEFIDYARSHPGELNFGTSGLGGATHLPGELLHYLTRTRVTFVHYKQPSQRMLDLMAGRLQATFVAFPTGVPLIKSGKIRAIGVTSLQRSPGFPDVPTIAEEVSPGFEYSSWMGLVAPGRTPPAIVNRLNTLFVTAGRNSPKVRDFESDGGSQVVNSTSEQLRLSIINDTDKWKKLIQATGIKPTGD